MDCNLNCPNNLPPEIAEEYAKAPLVDHKAIYSWCALAREIGRLYPYVLKKGVTIVTTPKTSYQTYDEIRRDVEQGRIIRSVDFYPHPVWDIQTQRLFRVVHDYFHYEAGLDFTIEAEKQICETHHKKVFSPEAYPAVVVEIYGQAAYGVVYGRYAPNKVFIPRMARAEYEAYCIEANCLDKSNEEANKVLNLSMWGLNHA